MNINNRRQHKTINHPPTKSKKCHICGQEYKKVNHQHLKTHDISYDDYLKKYEKKYYFFNQLAEKVDDLYIRKTSQWLQQTKNGEYITCTNKITEYNKRDWPLNISDIKQHLIGNKTLGIMFENDCSHMLGLDIDIKPTDGGIEALENLCSLVDGLGLSNASLASFSGSKGYHLDVFFLNWIKNEMIEEFYELILSESGYKKNQIELRGGESKAGYKLPLGVHQKTDVPCNIVNKHGEIISHIENAEYEEIYQVLNNLEPVSEKKFKLKIKSHDSIKEKQILNEGKNLSKEMTPLESTWDKAHTNKTILERIKQIETRGINKPGTRKMTAVSYAILLTHIGKNKMQIETRLKKWHESLNKNYYDTDKSQCFKDYESIAEDVINNDYKVKSRKFVGKKPTITLQDMEIILTPEKNSRRKVLYALLAHGKVFGGDDGIFYMTYEMIREATGTNNKNVTLKKYIKDLEKKSLVKIIQDNTRNKGTHKHQPNYYQVPSLNTAIETELDAKRNFNRCQHGKMKCDNCFLKTCKTMISEKTLDKKFSGKTRKKFNFSVNKCPKNKKLKQLI